MTTTGLDLSDIPGCYRDRAQQIADGERVALLLEALNVLSNAAINCNAEAAN